MERSARTRGWLIQLGTALTLVGTFGFFLWVWVPARQHSLRERNFRILGGMSDQIAESLVNLQGSIKNAADAASGKDVTNPVVEFRKKVALIQPRVEEISPFTNAPDSKTAPELTLSEHRGIGNTWLHFSGKGPALASNAYSFHVRINLNELLEPMVSLHDFDDILLVKSNGEAIFELAEVRSRLTNLLAGSELRIIKLPQLVTEKEEPNGLFDAASLTNVMVSGTEYNLAVQPMRFSFSPDANKDVTRWYLCGLISKNRLRSQALDLPPTAIILFVFAAAVVLISWPFLNLFYCGPRDEVGRGEAFGIAFSSYIASATITFLFLDLLIYPQVKRQLDGDLGMLASTVFVHVTNELAQADRELRNLSDRLAFMAGQMTGDEQDDFDYVEDLRRKTAIFSGQGVFPSNAPPDYPFLKMAVWVNAKGSQLVKWSAASSVTPSISVADRNYFRVHAEGKAWPQNLSTSVVSALPRGFYFEPVFSRTRGENVAIYSIPFTNRWPGRDIQYLLVEKPSVAYLEFRPLSLFHPVLPPGYRFCVIDAQGRVLFHSDERRNLRENFIKEVETSPRLLAALRARVADQFNGYYLNRPHRVHVAPMEGLPWTVVTMRDKHHLAASHGTMLAAGAILFVIYTGGILLLAVGWRLCANLGLALRPGRSSRWLTRLWPDEHFHDAYLAVFAMNVALGVFLSFGVLVVGSSNWVIVATAILPVLAVLFAGSQLNRSGRNRAEQVGGLKALFNWRTAYILSLGSLLLIIAVLPTFACFQLALRQEKEVFIKSTQLGVGREIRGRNARLGADPTLAPVVSTNLLWRRLTNTFDSYFPSVLQTTTEPAAPGWAKANRDFDLARLLYGLFRPVLGVLRVETGNLLGNRADDNSWRSETTATGFALDLAGEDELGRSGALRLHSKTLSASPGEIWLWPLYLAGMILIIGVPFYLAWFLARYLMLIDLPANGGPIFLSKTAKSAQQFHLLHPTGIQLAIRPASERFIAFEKTCILIVDLSRKTDCSRWLQSGETQPPKRETQQLKRDAVIAIAHLDQDLGIDGNRAKRLWVSELDHDPAKTIIVIGPLDDAILVEQEKQEGQAESNNWWRLWINSLCPTWRKPLARDASAPVFNGPESIARELARRYERTWQKRSAREKVTLHEVARNGFSSLRRPELRSLLADRLLRLDPQLRLCNESFRRFVLARFDVQEIRAELPSGEESVFRWNSVKTTLGITLTLVAVFLFITQREAWTLVVGLASTFATGFGQLSKIPGLIPKRPDKTDAGNG